MKLFQALFEAVRSLPYDCHLQAGIACEAELPTTEL
jgi:hypothetical protein